jgi:exodeoxyribonuclease V alpha subunit
VHDAFRRHGRRIADHAHPHYRGARDTARATAAAAAQTWTAYESAASRYEQQLWRYGLLAGTPHPQQTLDRLTHRITDTQRRLDHARGDLATLTREPALRTLPADRLTAERDTWQATRTAQQKAAITHAARTHPSTVRVGPAHDPLLPPPSPVPGIGR